MLQRIDENEWGVIPEQIIGFFFIKIKSLKRFRYKYNMLKKKNRKNNKRITHIIKCVSLK